MASPPLSVVRCSWALLIYAGWLARSSKILRASMADGQENTRGYSWSVSCLRANGNHQRRQCMLDGLIGIAGGILAASALIIARKPNAKELIDKLTPYQGWIGVVMFGWGIWEILGCLRFMSLLSVRPGLWA